MQILLLCLLILVCLGGILLAALQLPGTWIILAAAVGYDAWHGWACFGWPWLVALGALAGGAELLETLASVSAARRAGASRRAAAGAVLGGFAGMLLCSIPVPVIGTIVGGFIGCFAGAIIAELTVHDDVVRGAKVGLFATIGRLLGLIAKLAAAVAIAGAVAALAIVSYAR